MSGEARERSLAARIAAGDVHAFAALLNRLWQPLVEYAAHKLGGQDAAEDVVQEAFVRLWAHRTTLKKTVSPRGYLYRLSHNLTIDELRKRQVRGTHAELADPAQPPPPTPAEIREGTEIEEIAGRAVRALPPRRRDVFVLAYFHDLSYRQIAETLGITPRTVANHMTLALRELRVALRPFLDRER